MTGNVNNIVESMFAAEHARSRQNTANTKTTAKTGSSFSDYLNYALLNSQAGALFGTGSGIGLSYPYTNPLSGSFLQTYVLKALIDGIQKNSQSTAPQTAGTAQETDAAAQTAKKKPDWAKVRVIRHYQAPVTEEKKGILV